MRIGIFGGTFNPIHQGHLAIAEEVRRAIGLEKVLFVVAGDPPHKKDQEVIPVHHRLEMTRLAVEDHTGFELCDLEVRRPGKSYTVDTVEALKAAYPPETEWYLLLGLDAFLDFPTWRGPDRLLSLCHLAVVSRPGFRFEDLKRLPYLKEAETGPLKKLDQGRLKRYELPLSLSTRLILLRVSPWEVSATEIRSHLSGGKRRRNLLPGRVESYIIGHHLYAYSK